MNSQVIRIWICNLNFSDNKPHWWKSKQFAQKFEKLIVSSFQLPHVLHTESLLLRCLWLGHWPYLGTLDLAGKAFKGQTRGILKGKVSLYC